MLRRAAKKEANDAEKAAKKAAKDAEKAAKKEAKDAEKAAKDAEKAAKKEAKEAEKAARKAAPKGAGCSSSGLKYEQEVAESLRNSKLNGVPLSCSDPAGSSAGNDLTLTIEGYEPIGIEVKRPTPDWMQVRLSYSESQGTWAVDPDAPRSKIPPQCREIFSQSLGEQELWDGKVPSFLQQPVLYEDWVEEKSGVFEDYYFDCSDSLISELYGTKGCPYIQVANKGLYSLQEDPLALGVPSFRCTQRVRIRVKVHGRTSKQGLYASLSVTAAAQPVSPQSSPRLTLFP